MPILELSGTSGELPRHPKLRAGKKRPASKDFSTRVAASDREKLREDEEDPTQLTSAANNPASRRATPKTSATASAHAGL